MRTSVPGPRTTLLPAAMWAMCGWVAVAQADARPAVVMVRSEADRWYALEPLPDSRRIDLVILGGPKPELRADGKAVPIRSCGDEPPRWCADDVPMHGLKLGGDFPATLVGPDAVVVANGRADDSDPDHDPFDDAVLVGGPKGYRCSGVLLDDLHVLTAGHCAPSTRIGLGANAEVALQVAVADNVIHPSADVAVLRLTEPVSVATHGRRRVIDSAPPVGRVRVIGFGVRDPLRFIGFGTRRQVDVLVNGWGCEPLRAARLGCHPGFEMHARDVSGNDTCFGDSGGPVFEATAYGWRLIAITSRGAQPRRLLCGEGGIYVRAA